MARFIILLCATLLLQGCDKLKEWDDVRAAQKVEATQLSAVANELATTRSQLTAAQSELAKTQVELALLKERLVALEAKKNTVKADHPVRLSTAQVATLRQVIAKCVTAVRESGKGETLQFLTDKFDAYYNEASGLVQNNASGGAPSVFLFNKCMAAQGVPLT